MPEVRRPVQPIEINYLCDQCEHGMMQRCGDTDPVSGITPHQCVICGHKQDFAWVVYPRIDYVGLDES